MSKKERKQWDVIAVEVELKKELVDYCKANGSKIYYIVRRALEEYMDKH